MSSKGSKLATIRDVAQRAGVAPSTVSYVLNGSRSISEETRERVREAVDALGYHPRASARTLRSSRTRVIALALPRRAGLQHSVDGRFAIELSDAAHGLGFDLLLTTSRDKAEGLRRVALSGLADAAVLMAVDMEDARIDVVREVAFPAALIGRPADENALPWTDLDWAGAAALAVRTLAAAGHRSLVYLAPSEAEVRARRSYALRGIEGARGAAAATGCAVEVVHSLDDPAGEARRLRALLTDDGVSLRPGGPTALVVQHPSAHHHLLASMPSATGLRVPDDLPMVVIGTLPEDRSSSALSRIELPVRTLADEVTRLAVAAAEALRQRRGASEEPGARLLAAALGHLLVEPELLPGPTPLAPPQH
ncbi:LacI family DNA-binding transcriptional regulator [Streptomyces sp. NPDC050560]|uniref:LacI family DNA-binding transcriptional regulator n=1 Tax=Streptomyces sp. NPDC050560 TaxID=3365630 RepID=UPI00379839FD